MEFAPISALQFLFGDECQILKDQGFVFINFTSLNRWGEFIYDGMAKLILGDALVIRPYEIDVQDTSHLYILCDFWPYVPLRDAST